MFSRILVPLDGSKLAERSVPHAEQFARIFGSVIVFLQVLDPSPFQDQAQTTEPLSWQIRKTEADLYLQQVAASTRARGLETEHIILEGKTPENIVDFAQSSNIDLIVMSSHGASGLSRWNTNSVIQKVISKVYLPVLVVRAYTHLEEAETENLYQRILVPFDASRRAECVLPAATTLSQACDAILVLAGVAHRPEVPIPPPHPAEVSELEERFLQIIRDSFQAYLTDLQSRLSVASMIRVVENDSVIGAIHDLAEQENVDLVIFCAHGQTGRFNWPYGSVVSNYIEYGEKSVLVVQDVPIRQVRQTRVEIAAEKYGSR